MWLPRSVAFWGVAHYLITARTTQTDVLDTFIRQTQLRVPVGAAAEQHHELCGQASAGYGPNFFLTRTSQPEDTLGALEFAVIESLLFHHPLANVFVVAQALTDGVFDEYLRQGYCVIWVPLRFEWFQRVVEVAEPTIAGALTTLSAARNFLPFLLNCALLSLQLLHGGVTLSMDGLLLNPFDSTLPAPLSLRNTAVFLERALGPEELAPQYVLTAEDFEHSWNPRSHTDRADGRTTLCGDVRCPRSMPAGCSLGKELLHSWLSKLLQSSTVPGVDEDTTRLYKSYIARRHASAAANLNGKATQRTAAAGGCEAFALPGWVVVESHFPDGWRYFGHRGAEESEDRPHFHSQLFTARAHRESSDWWLVRSAKLWLPLDYGPPSARNVMPRSVVDLAQRLLSLKLAPYPTELPLHGVNIEAATVTQASGVGRSATPAARHWWRTPLDVFRALDNSMAQSLGIGRPPDLSREAALPGAVGGFRTFRDVRIVGSAVCLERSSDGSVLPVARVRTTLQMKREGAFFFCRPGERPESAAGKASNGDVTVDSAYVDGETPAHRACTTSISSNGMSFELTAMPSLVNAALGILAYRPLPGLGHDPGEAVNSNFNNNASTGLNHIDARLNATALRKHFAELHLELSEACDGMPTVNTTTTTAVTGTEQAVAKQFSTSVRLEALLDDVQDQVTVVAHSAERCQLLDRLGASFREIYERLPIVVTCECAEDEAKSQHCNEHERLPHPKIPSMTVVSVPFDFGLSRGKRLLVQLVKTEFVLVLDDDFVRSPLSCLECMLWHMRSRMHSLTLPFDTLGFPILEDERNFGAFRGQLRAHSGRLFLEPMASEAAVDGCMRVGIHPMAFLARTARLRGFRFQDQLQVGEHEQFFYANQYLGLHAAVCFDSMFPHFRVPSSDGYKARRDRMQSLMTKEFEKIGFPSMMYLLTKYDAYSGFDHSEFIHNDVPPWHVSHDTCGPEPDPPADFAMFFVAVISSLDEEGAEFRQLLRGRSNSAASGDAGGVTDPASSIWLPRLAASTSTRWAFFVPSETPVPPDLATEEADFGDIIFMPPGRGAHQSASSLTSPEQLRFVLSFLRDFQFRWLLVAHHDVFVHIERLFGALVVLDPPVRTVLGSWQQMPLSLTPSGQPVRSEAQPLWLLPQLFAMTRDVHHLLTSHRVLRWLQTEGFDSGNVADSGLASALNAWLAPLAMQRVSLPGVHVASSTWGTPTGPCPEAPAVLHPVRPEEMLLLSQAALQGCPCTVLNETRRLWMMRRDA